MIVEFKHRLDRSSPVDHEIDLEVCATVRRVQGEPGSLSVTPGWVIESLRVDAVGGEHAPYKFDVDSLTSDETEAVESEVLRRAALSR